MAEIIPKMRLQLYDTEFNMLSDRLVEQGPEFAKGPKEAHAGPLKIEFSLFTQEAAEQALEYLGKLKGSLPIADRKLQKRGRKKIKDSSPSFREELVEMIKASTNPKLLTDALREQGFVFTSLEYLEDLGNPLAVGPVHRKKYQWLVRLIRKAKNPLNNRYDMSLLIGFKDNKLIVYSGDEVIWTTTMEGTIETHIKVPVKFKVKFPPYMSHEERAQFRIQMEKMKADPTLAPTRLYTRWLSDTMRASPLSIEFPGMDTIKDMYQPALTVQEVQANLREEKNA